MLTQNAKQADSITLISQIRLIRLISTQIKPYGQSRTGDGRQKVGGAANANRTDQTDQPDQADQHIIQTIRAADGRGPGGRGSGEQMGRHEDIANANLERKRNNRATL